MPGKRKNKKKNKGGEQTNTPKNKDAQLTDYSDADTSNFASEAENNANEAPIGGSPGKKDDLKVAG